MATLPRHDIERESLFEAVTLISTIDEEDVLDHNLCNAAPAACVIGDIKQSQSVGDIKQSQSDSHND